MISKHTKTFLAASLLLAIILSPAARAAEWTVVKTFGHTWIEETGVRKTALSRGRSLSGAAAIITGDDGKVVLVRGDESIVLAPNSMVRLHDGNLSGQWTTISQESGAATYVVHKRSAPHFRVETPTLAALVKGTTFKVVENRHQSKVWVAEGLVQVTVHATRESVHVSPNQSAVLDRRSGGQLNIVGPGPKDTIIRAATDRAGHGVEAGKATAAARSAAGRATAAAASAAGKSAGSAASAAGRAVSSVASSAGGNPGGRLR